MKKLSKIFAVVLCLVMVLSMLPMGAAAAAETITYDFSGVSGYSTQVLTNDQVKSAFTNGASGSGLVNVTATNIYKGNGDGGQFSKQGGFLKAGKSNTDGKLVLTMEYASTITENAEGGLDITVNYGQMGDKTYTLTADQANAILN